MNRADFIKEVAKQNQMNQHQASVFGNEPLEDLLAAYICDRIKGENNSDEAAA